MGPVMAVHYTEGQLLSLSKLGEGVTTIYAGTGYAISGVPFFEQKINFGASFLVKSQGFINLGCQFRKITL